MGSNRVNAVKKEVIPGISLDNPIAVVEHIVYNSKHEYMVKYDTQIANKKATPASKHFVKIRRRKKMELNGKSIKISDHKEGSVPYHLSHPYSAGRHP